MIQTLDRKDCSVDRVHVFFQFVQIQWLHGENRLATKNFDPQCGFQRLPVGEDAGNSDAVDRICQIVGECTRQSEPMERLIVTVVAIPHGGGNLHPLPG